ncbi:hypothetical protein B1992_04155 [Pseudoxanthomonas broegbernensis]|uniref:J domain-containing protein n=1 Tax=Pseudoxanthomonas broegbernensis TaxID=83619 RepID=A0A7V8GNU6_9GAMM|nr:J domain-containing protein [Pseudoxanthomonas broegbernensis]KAF1687189.1 hypothetical protein B1992_04155 [Pseudoxanthomonas broegbernensis]MBB6065830.1 hypothetical protein [Pseudoxanthomonas broegbernensis]
MPGEDALSLAIDLFRTPSLRHAARAKPVPDRTGELLLLAAGQPARLDEAAARTGMDAAELLEAARFFVREVLLHPDADDYRVLGLRQGADFDSIKAHHRILQAWLHPDRADSQAEQAFAARVNVAWNRLRLAQRNPQPADEAQVGDPAPPPDGDEPEPAAVYSPRWIRIDPDEERRPRSHVAVPIALLLVCGLLLWLIARQAPPPAETPPAEKQESPVAFLFDGLRLQSPEDAPEPAAADAGPHPAPPAAEPVAGTRAATGQSSASRAAPVPSRTAGADPARIAPPPPRRAAPDPGPAAPTTTATTTEAATAAARRLPAPAPATSMKAVASETAASAASGTAHPPAGIAGAGSGMPARSDEAHPPATPADAGPRRAATATARPVAAAIADATAGEPSAAYQPLHPELAQARLESLLVFVAQHRVNPPPIWRNVRAMETAERIRQSLVEHGTHRFPTLVREQTRWTHQPGRAWAVVPVAWPAPDPSIQRLHAELTWRDGDWMIDSVALEDAAP